MATFANSQQVKALLKDAAPGMHSDAATTGLYLSIKGKQRSWAFVYTKDGKRREMGLGTAVGDAAVSLADARQKATGARALLNKGIDPLEHKRAGKPRVGVPTLGEMAEQVIQGRTPGWKDSGKSEKSWRQTLSLTKGKDGKPGGHCRAIVNKRVDAIGVDDVLAVLQPIWATKRATARSVRQRLEIILAAAKAAGHRPAGTDNPASFDLLRQRLPRVKRRIRHHPSMPYAAVPGFLASLVGKGRVGATALRFAILTATRETEAAGAIWSEVNLETRMWTIGAKRMKADRQHSVPLSAAAVALLQDMAAIKPESGDAPVFPGYGDVGLPIEGQTLLKVLKATHPDLTVHGFRTSFRTFCQDRFPALRDAAEACLAHVIGDNEAERAYSRSDLLEQRRALLEAWGRHCTGTQAATVSRRLVRVRRLVKRRPVPAPLRLVA